MARTPRREDYDNGEVDLTMVDSMQLIDELRRRFPETVIALLSQPQQDICWPRVHFNGDLIKLLGMCDYSKDVILQVMKENLGPPRNI